MSGWLGRSHFEGPAITSFGRPSRKSRICRLSFSRRRCWRDIDRVDGSLQRGVDGHKVAEHMMTLMGSYYPFRVERDGIGKAAEVGYKAQRSISAAQAARRNNATDTRSPVERFVAEEAK